MARPEAAEAKHAVVSDAVKAQKDARKTVSTRAPRSTRQSNASEKSHSDSQSNGSSIVPTRMFGKLKLNKQDKQSRAASPSRCHAAGCVCELCNCGYHHCTSALRHCPKKSKRIESQPFLGKSGYREDYRPFGSDEVERIPKFTPELRTKLWDGETRVGQSNYKVAYKKPLMETFVRASGPPMEQSNIAQPFEGSTLYRSDFKGEVGDAPRRGAPAQSHRSTIMPRGKIQDTTTQRQDYDKKEMPAPRRSAPPEMQPSVPFEGTSEYRNRFPKHKLDRSAPIKSADDSDIFAGPKMHFSTTYRDDHDVKELTPFCRRNPVPEYKRDNTLTGTTTHRDTFITHPLDNCASVPKVAQDTQPWNRGTDHFQTESRATYGESIKNVTQCPAAVLMCQHAVCCPPSDRSHIYFDDRERKWY